MRVVRFGEINRRLSVLFGYSVMRSAFSRWDAEVTGRNKFLRKFDFFRVLNQGIL